MSVNFQEGVDQLKKERDKLQQEKDCKSVIFFLKDFETIKTIARKIRAGHCKIQNFSLNERLCMKYMHQRRFVGDEIRGLLNSKNIHGHTRVSIASIDQCRRLALEHDVFGFFKVRGTVRELLNFAQATKGALKTIQQFVRFNLVGMSVRYETRQVSCRGR